MTSHANIWPTARIGALGRLSGGGTPSRTRPDYFEGEIPWLTGQDIPEGNVTAVSAGRERITQDAIANSATNLVPAGAVLVTTRVTVGKVAVTAAPLCFSQDVTAIQLHDARIADPFFLAYFLLSRRERLLRLNQGSTISGITREGLAQERVPLPPLSEQRRVVEMLREAEAVRRLRADADRKTAELIPAIFHEMFGDPPTWLRPVKLSEAVTIVGGGTPSRAESRHFEGDIPWATSKDIKRAYLDDAEEHINEEAIKASATNLVLAGTILLVVKSKILMHSLPMAIVSRPFCFGQDLKGLVPREGFTPEFISAALSVQKADILRKARGVNTEGLTIEILRRIELPRTTPDGMREFQRRAWLVRDVASETAKSAKSFESATASLLSHAFTGELTASWRQRHARTLAQEARQRDAALKQAGAALARPSSPTEPRTAEAFDPELVAELTGEQRALLAALARRWQADRERQLFAAKDVAEDTFAELGLSEDTTRRQLDVLAARGLLLRVARERPAEGAATEFAVLYRRPRAARAFVDDHDDRAKEELDRLAARLAGKAPPAPAESEEET